jgi:hypothetical protein
MPLLYRCKGLFTLVSESGRAREKLKLQEEAIPVSIRTGTHEYVHTVGSDPSPESIDPKRSF